MTISQRIFILNRIHWNIVAPVSASAASNKNEILYNVHGAHFASCKFK